MYPGNYIVKPADLMNIPVGSIIIVGAKHDEVHVLTEEDFIDRYISISSDSETGFYAACLDCTWDMSGSKVEQEVFAHAQMHVKKEKAASLTEAEEHSVWFVYASGKATVVDSHYPNGETEDLDWFRPWEVTVIGFNPEYARM